MGFIITPGEATIELYRLWREERAAAERAAAERAARADRVKSRARGSSSPRNGEPTGAPKDQAEE